MSTLRILHVIPRLGGGGVDKVVRDLMQIQASSHDLHLCNLEYSGSLRDIAGIYRCKSRLKNDIASFRPHVVHAHLWPAVLFASGTAVCGSIPCVAHVHDRSPWLESTAIRQRIQRMIYQSLMSCGRTTLVAVADAVRQHTAKHLHWPLNEIHVVHNGVNLPERGRKSIQHSQLTIGTAGRLVREKGFDNLIRAVGIVRSRDVNCHLLIAGDGSQRPFLQDLANQLGLVDFVQFLGVVADMAEFYGQLDLFVLPSFTEGLPMTLLEAMAYELPTIATNVGGVPELIDHGVNGLLVPPGDPDSLAECILRLSDGDLRHQLGLAARTRITAAFTIETMVQQLDKLYAELTN